MLAKTHSTKPNLKKLTILTAAAVLLLFNFTLLQAIPTTRAQATTTKYLNGKVVFASDRDGNSEIYTMNADGSNQTRITTNPSIDFGPRWSPDGNKIVFASDRDGNYEIYTMNPDGSNQVRVSNNISDEHSFSFSPDGSKLAFTSTRDNANGEVYTMNLDGSNVVRLTNNTQGSAAPDWSSTNKLVFKSNRSGNNEVYTMNPDGTNQINITNNSANDQGAKWSPDGSKLAFWSTRGGVAETYTMNADGSNVVRLTTNVFDDRSASYSPDGSLLVFVSGRGGGVSQSWNIFTMNTDGSNPIQLTFTDLNRVTFGLGGNSPDWQPLPYQVTTNDDGSVVSTVSASSTYTSTDYTVAPGETLVLDGTLCDVTVKSGGTLLGTGSIASGCSLTVEPGGMVGPGHSPGCLTSGNLILSGTYAAELASTTACTGYDQLQVTGTVTLTGSTLTPSLLNNFIPKAGDSFTLIQNDASDVITGTFNNLPEGATITIGSTVFKVSYIGGDGNDVSLRVVAVPGVPNTGYGHTLR